MRAVLIILGVVLAAQASSSPSLPSYNVNINQSSVSGLSSGGYFAVQMQVAFSSSFVGAGIFAGGPYHCSEGSLNTALHKCMETNKEPNVTPLVSITNDRAQTGDIDPTSSLAKHQVYMFSGTKDTTVPTAVMNGLRDYYKSFIDDSQVDYENKVKAAHTQPTDDPVNKNACDKSASPYLSDCDYDGSGIALKQIYGTLKPRNDGQLSGSLIEFNQREFIGNNLGMADSGWMYVPADCGNLSQCKLHIAFHGCKQDYAAVGSDFIENAGYNKWADTNSMIILYPQTKKSVDPYNIYGCWDWWGYTNPNNFDIKTGAQMNAVWEMMQRISSGYVSIFPPVDLKASNVTEESVSLQWNPSSSPNVVYNVFRNGTQVNTDPVNGLKFQDNTVDSGTVYSYTVGSQNGQGQQSAPSAPPVTVTTGGTPPPLQAPQNLVSSDTTAFYVVLSWNSASGATSYNVYRNNSFLASSTTTTFNDTTVSPVSTYVYQVTATNGADESSPSSSLQITTPTGFVCAAYTSSNYVHVEKKRAYEKLGYAYADGSNQNMGLDNTAIFTTLAETSEGYYVIGSC